MKRLVPFLILALVACDGAPPDPHAGLDGAEVAAADTLIATRVPATASAIDRMHLIGHGRVFDAAGREVPLTPDYLARLQEELYARLAPKARVAPAERKRLSEARSLARTLPGAQSAALMTAVNAKLLDGAPAATRAELGWRLGFLARDLPAPQGEAALPILPQRFRDLATIDLSSFLKPGILRLSTAYMNRCVEEGVPIPPPWSAANPNGWTYHGQLNGTLISAGIPAHLWTWSPGERAGFPFFPGRIRPGGAILSEVTLKPLSTGARGACILLPRGTGGTDVAGIWCQSATTGRACVWDNLSRRTGARMDWSTETLDVARMQDGDTLPSGDTCTACHRGNNAFLISPDDPTWAKVIRPGRIARYRRPNLTTNLDAGAGPRFTMVSNQPGWTNAAGGQCIGCHERPAAGFAAVPSPMPAACSTTGNTTAGCYTMP